MANANCVHIEASLSQGDHKTWGKTELLIMVMEAMSLSGSLCLKISLWWGLSESDLENEKMSIPSKKPL